MRAIPAPMPLSNSQDNHTVHRQAFLKTHKNPTRNMALMAIFLRILIWRDQIYIRSKSSVYHLLTRRAFTIGIGIAIIKISVMMSVAVKTVNTSKVFEHWAKKSVIGAQLRLQFSPHWNTFVKKNIKLHVDTTTIITQLALLNARTWPKIRRQRNKTESFIRPKAIFSVIWNPYLYYKIGVRFGSNINAVTKIYLPSLPRVPFR